MKTYIAEVQVYETGGFLPDLFGELQRVRIVAENEKEAKGKAMKQIRNLRFSYGSLKDIYLEV